MTIYYSKIISILNIFIFLDDKVINVLHVTIEETISKKNYKIITRKLLRKNILGMYGMLI